MANDFTALTNAWISFQGSIRESFFRNTGIPYRNLIGLLLGFTASALLLSGEVLTIYWASLLFASLLAATMITLVLFRPYNEKKVDRFAWGLLVIVLLGFGFGILEYQTRSWWIWLWRQYLRIKEPHDLILESLFLLGVILGFFVVRNWAKEQKDFVSSLSAVLSGAFVATILGKLQEGTPITPMRAFAYYALGFTMSGTINLIAAARLTANYTNKRSIASRAMLDFLYGSERTKLIDGYFLQNFKDDPDYAKARLIEALIEYRRLIAREFAERMEKRMRAHDQRQTSADVDRLYYYQLINIECEEKEDAQAGTVLSPPSALTKVEDKDKQHYVTYRQLGASQAANSESPNNGSINEEMFRVGVAARWQDTLEYISAPGEYRVAFPFLRSVSGLALLSRQTIVMDRDSNRRFRDKDHGDGICPSEIEQARGLDEIDFLSYVAVPIIGRSGSSNENNLGVVTIDSRLFVAPELKNAERVKPGEGIFRAKLTPRQLTGFAAQLYEHEDPDVKYIEKVTKIIVPVMELYSKCRVGAT
jgi:hypothetical protein